MLLFRKIPIKCHDTEYEIRILYDDTTINVVAFHNNHPANGYRHQVKLPQKCDVHRLLETYPVPDLVEMSKNDLTEKRWEALSKIIQENTQVNL